MASITDVMTHDKNVFLQQCGNYELIKLGFSCFRFSYNHLQLEIQTTEYKWFQTIHLYILKVTTLMSNI